MVQFLSINFFFLDFFNFCWVFQKFPFFCVTLYIDFRMHGATIKEMTMFSTTFHLKQVRTDRHLCRNTKCCKSFVGLIACEVKTLRYVRGSKYSRCDGDYLRAISGTRLQMAIVGNPFHTLAMWVIYLRGEFVNLHMLCRKQCTVTIRRRISIFERIVCLNVFISYWREVENSDDNPDRLA